MSFSEQSQREMRQGFAASFKLNYCRQPVGLSRRQRIRRRRLLLKQARRYHVALQREWNAMLNQLLIKAIQKVFEGEGVNSTVAK